MKQKRLNKDEIADLVTKMETAGQAGLTVRSFCNKENVPSRTLYEIAERKPAVKQAIAKLREDCAGYWEAKFAHAALRPASEVNTTALIFMLKNIAGWRDKREVEVSGEAINKIEVEIIHKADESRKNESNPAV